MSKIAVNISDLTRYDEIPRQCLIAPVVSSRTSIDGEPGRLDGNAVVLECDDARARAIIAILRAYDTKAKRYQLRAYVQGPRGGWKKLP